MLHIVAALLAQFVVAQSSPSRYALAKDSRLVINGDSNVHAWSCEAKKVDATVSIDPQAPQLANSVFVYIPISAIDCGNGTMNDKMRDALHAKEHPAIFYKLISAERLPGDAVKLATRGELTINGEKRPVDMVVNGTQEPDGSIRASGSLPIKMTTYKVDPPGALFLHTKDDLTVKFDVHITQRPEAHASR